jgi:hypothetical protein
MSGFTYPTVTELRAINQDLQPKLAANSPVWAHFPLVDIDSDMLRWEQRDDYTGMQQVRGINGQPGVVQAVGSKAYLYQPGYYGEVSAIDEQEITRRAQIAQISGRPMSIDDLVMDRNRFLVHRENVLMEYIIWTLLGTGTFSIAKDGNVIHTDTYPVQTSPCAVVWSTPATATPLADFRAAQVLEEGHGISFGAGATAYMNRATFNEMMSNTNLNDLAGKLRNIFQVVGGGGDNALADLALVNKIMLAADLPQIAIYNEGYKNAAGVFTKFIPNDVVIIIGQRTTGEPLGEYRRTINANNEPVGPGSYSRVVDSAMPGNPNPVPRKVEVHRGHNGGPVIFYPSGVVVMSV